MLSKTAEYALRAVVCLASFPGESFSGEILAEKTQVPRSYLHRVLQDLVQGGLVHSRPGPGGGYEFSRVADQVTILDVVNAVHPLERIRQCPLGLPDHVTLCPLHQELDRAYAATETAFREVKLSDMIGVPGASVPLCDVSPRDIPPSDASVSK